ncbi:DUF5305 domain-containing protein [Halosegnis marinus]|uniref:DUF5305 domain-containing protein n=1 Tax=Halosegnis marinus TaxID=3034023 RepID=A0ABD5ZQD5_9EURY|nr:DUF5305 domain-containing protein [Halosegnis sp. DT85]
MTDAELRARRLLADNLAVVALVVLVVAGAGAFLTYDAHLADETTTETETVVVYETVPAFTHGATVRRENPVFEVGTRLEERGQYYTRIAPVVDGEFRFTYVADDGDTTVRLAADRVIRAVAEDGTVLWEQRRALDTAEATGLAPGETATVPYRVNVSELQSRVDNVTEALGTGGSGVETVVAVEVRMTGTVGGERVNTTRTHDLELSAGDGTYSATGNASGTTERRERVRTVPAEAGPLAATGGPVLLALGLLGGGALAVGRRRGLVEVSDAERARLAFAGERAEFDEWITAAELPDSAVGDPADHIRVADLEGLVDVAIDTDGRVIEDESRGGFFVVSGDRTYRYDRPAPADGDDPLEPAIRRVED